MTSSFIRKRADDRNGEKSRNFIDAALGPSDRKKLTADKFLQIWQHYDKDGNRFLEGKELDKFLKDFLNSSLTGVNFGKTIRPEELNLLKQHLLSEFDQNGDGKISIQELSKLLSPEEAFFLLFRLDNGPERGIDYMKIWKKYDRDLSGFIEADELKMFLRDMILRATRQKSIDERRLESYTRTILDLFDSNQDGKLSFSELARMLPANENFVQRLVEKVVNVQTLTQGDLRKLLNSYDKDGSQTLEGSELTSLSKDILEILRNGEPFSARDVQEMQDSILTGCDVDQNGRIDLRELGVIISAVISSAVDKAGSDQLTSYYHRILQGSKAQHIASYVPGNY